VIGCSHVVYVFLTTSTVASTSRPYLVKAVCVTDEDDGSRCSCNDDKDADQRVLLCKEADEKFHSFSLH